jgi:HlyD family secretion protein
MKLEIRNLKMQNAKCRIIAEFVIPFFLILGACSKNNDGEISASGTIEAVEIKVSAKTPGQIISFKVEEGSSVNKGDTITIVDYTNFSLQLRQVEAGVDLAQAQYNLLLNGPRKEDVELAEENLRQAETNLKSAENDLNRMKELMKTNSATQKQLDDSQNRYTITLAQFNSAKQNLNKLKDWSRPEELQSARARLAQARSSVDLLKKSISDCYITAPVSGIITNKTIEEGELVNPGGIIATISKLDKVNLMIYVSETDLGKVKLGQSTKIQVDAFPDKSFDGKVVYISPIAEFTPKNIQTKEDRTKLVFGVKIEIDNKDLILKSGMPADAMLLGDNTSSN